MSRPGVKCRIIKEDLNPLFHFKNNAEDDKVCTANLLKLALKTGTLKLSNKNLSSVPEKVWSIEENEELQPDAIDLNRKQNESDLWWNKKSITTLDLSSNVLISLSSNIKNLLDLITLNLQDNALTTLPKEIGLLEKLTRINLSRNKINELPNDFFRLRELKYLNLSYNGLTDISADLSDLVMLEVLDLSNNKLESFPEGVGFMVRLIEIQLHHNHLQKLPNDIVNLRNLQKLDIMNNDIKFLPKYMGDLRKLEFIYAQHNDIDVLPDLEGCDQLQELHMSNNFIKEIPEQFCEKLPNLKVLDLRDNKIEVLPNEISMLQSLMRLDLSNNSINSLPSSLATLANLMSLQVDGNPIRSIRRDIISCGTQRILKTLRDRDGSVKSDRKSLPEQTIPETEFPSKYQLKKSRILTLCGKGLTEVPEQVFLDAKEADIEVVDFTKNKLQSIPEGLQHMSSMIAELNCNNNCLKQIPSFIAQFSYIKYLNLSCNQLDVLPNEVGLLITLREININNNRFQEFPKCIYELVNLEIILACDNKITNIDAGEEGLAALKSLGTLDLSNNNMTAVPPILGNLTNLSNLLLHGNAFKVPGHLVLQKGTQSILSYLRDRIPK